MLQATSRTVMHALTGAAAVTMAAWMIPAQASEPVRLAQAEAQTPPASCKGKMRSVSVGVSTVPPAVIHTVPYVARDLGIFAKHCLDVKIVEIEGGRSPTMMAALSRGEMVGQMTEVAIGNGMKAKQIWQMAPRIGHAYTVSGNIKTPADLKGKRLNAAGAGGGVGGFNWRMGRAVLAMAGLKVEDAQFVPSTLAGRLPGLVAGQTDGVALQPEEVVLAMKRKPSLHVLVKLRDALPNLTFNTVGAMDSMIAEKHDVLVDLVASLIEASRTIYREKDKVIPIMVKATHQPVDAVEYGWKYHTDNCSWAVNTGFRKDRTEWTINYEIENDDMPAAKKPKYEDVVAVKLADEALAKAGGPQNIHGCDY